MGNRGAEIVEALRDWGLKLPGAHRKSPWPDHDDLAVKDKTFAYLPAQGHPFTLSCKLPYTGYEALQLPFAKPTAYGLGKSGWVTFNPPENEIPELDRLKSWVEESYRAQAPLKLVVQWDKSLGGE